MKTTVKTNRLAIASFVSGLIAFLSLGLTLYPVLFPPTPGNLPEPASAFSIFMDLSRSVRDLSTIVSLITGILVFREIKKKVSFIFFRPLTLR
jgi:hypothetical protein